MKKIISLFKRDYEGTRQVYNEVVEGAEWVIAGEGTPTVKYDGTCCMVRDGKLYKRYDRKLTKSKARLLKKNTSYMPSIEDYKSAPDGWEAAEPEPNRHTGHWPGWLPISEDDPQDKWHREAFARLEGDDGTYELVGPKIGNKGDGNPYQLDSHLLWRHGAPTIDSPPRGFDGLKIWFESNMVEGIVWHHSDGRMVKIKRRDFGLEWPVVAIKEPVT